MLLPSQQRLLQHAWAFLLAELDCDAVRLRPELELNEVCLGLHDWSHPSANVLGFDQLITTANRDGDFRLVLWSSDWDAGLAAALELLNRYQRLLPLPAACAGRSKLTQALAAHRLVHPLDDPRGRASYEHSLDAWRWLIRLNPHAELSLQLAALFHEAGAEEGCTTELGPPLGHDAKLGAVRLACRALHPLELDTDTLANMVGHIVGLAPSSRGDQRLLADADCLSFLSVSTWRYLRHHGRAATERRVTAAFSQMGDLAMRLALTTRQPRPISGMFSVLQYLGREAQASSGPTTAE
jgi:hypothetical protein